MNIRLPTFSLDYRGHFSMVSTILLFIGMGTASGSWEECWEALNLIGGQRFPLHIVRT